MKRACSIGIDHPWPCRAFDGSTHRRILYFARTRMLAAYVAENLDGAVSLEHLARLAGLNKGALCRYVRAKTGITPLDLVRLIRLSCAVELLESDDLHIGEVCARVGYRSLPTFSRTFRDCFGVSPATYRKTRVINLFLSDMHHAQGDIA